MELRVARPTDGVDIQAIYGPVVAETVISFEFDVPTVEEMTSRLVRTLDRHPWLVAEDGDRVVGYAYAADHSDRAAYGWSTDVSVYIHPEVRRTGVGRALYTALFEILRIQGFRRAFAGVTVPNPGSVGLHESMGFVPVGIYRTVGWKFGRWHDVGWWQHQLGAVDESPEPIIPFPKLAQTDIATALVRPSTCSEAGLGG